MQICQPDRKKKPSAGLSFRGSGSKNKQPGMLGNVVSPAYPALILIQVRWQVCDRVSSNKATL